MEVENFILESKPIEVASYENYKEATFLISVLGHPDLKGRIIPEDAGEKYHKTIIGFPVVAKLKKNLFGNPVDFGGHELVVTKDKNGKKHSRFGTMPIGSVIDSWIEEREVEGYEGTPKCILIKTKLWTSRFPEYFKVFDQLWDEGKIQSSWELTATDIEKKDENIIYKVFEFIGNTILGKQKVGAVPGAGVIEYAEYSEFEDDDIKLAEALIKDIANLNIDNEEMEGINLADKEKKTSVEDTENKSLLNPNTVGNMEVKKNETAACGIKKKKVASAELENPDDNEAKIASLEAGDLFRKVEKECKKVLGGIWGYIAYWFPDEKTVWFKADIPDATMLDYKLFTYEIVDDVVTVSEPQDVKLTVSIPEINTVVSEKDNQIKNLKTELASKDEAVIKAGEKINTLSIEISELRPYKDKVEIAERERIEAEIAEEKATLKSNMLKTNLFSEDEIASTEIAELIDARDKVAINNIIAERYIASFDNDNSNDTSGTEIASFDNNSNNVTANLDDDTFSNENPYDRMVNLYLKRK